MISLDTDGMLHCNNGRGRVWLRGRKRKAITLMLRHYGKPFDAASIGSAIAARAIMEDLRARIDGVGGGPPPFSKADRSRFLQALDRVLVGMGQRR